ncbi:MAG TPA: hypothetical protein VEX13_16580 [Chloroflexia bacterium]|nr:hypothetical protein [Chloroflexia bacterium]
MCYNSGVAPPRLPQEYVDRLVDLLLDVPGLAYAGAGEWRSFIQRAHLPPGNVFWIDLKKGPRTIAEQLMGSAANLVPRYSGPRRGYTDLGGMLEELVKEADVAEDDCVFMASLIVRYKLIPLDDESRLSPELRALLADLPPQEPPVWDGNTGMPRLPGSVSD